MTFRFDYNHRAEEQLSRDPLMGVAIGESVRKVKTAAERNAPHGPTGRYHQSIVEGGPRIGSDGFEGSVGSTDFAWHLVEFGSVNNRPYRVLERAVRESGLRFEERR